MDNLVKQHTHVIPKDKTDRITVRYKTITKAINREFWNSESDTLHSFYVGSYGRNTAVTTSDIDILVEIPMSEYERFNQGFSNGQSRFLQAVKNAILNSYPNSEVKADGQVVKINFADDIYFEVLPAFKKDSYSGKPQYIYPDTHMGGNWLSTNPKVEQEAMNDKDIESNGLLRATCKHFRYIRDEYFSSYHLSGIVIDSFVYEAMGGWHYSESGVTSNTPRGSYEKKLKDYFDDSSYGGVYLSLNAPGSEQDVDVSTDDLNTLNKVINKILQ